MQYGHMKVLFGFHTSYVSDTKCKCKQHGATLSNLILKVKEKACSGDIYKWNDFFIVIIFVELIGS